MSVDGVYSTTIIPAQPGFWLAGDRSERLAIIAWKIVTRVDEGGDVITCSVEPVVVAQTGDWNLWTHDVEQPDGSIVNGAEGSIRK